MSSSKLVIGRSDRRLQLRWAAAWCALAGLVLSGCPLLFDVDGGGESLAEQPVVELKTVALVEAPSTTQVAGWACHDTMDSQVGGLGGVACDLLGLPMPILDPTVEGAIRFTFRLDFDVTNTNAFPIPLLELALKLSVFTGQVERGLGAMCVSFCDPAKEGSCELYAPTGCAVEGYPDGSWGLEIDPLAVIDKLISLVTGEEELALDNTLIRVLEPGASTQVSISITIDPVLLLEVIYDVLFADTTWDKISKAEIPQVKIPYAVEGILFFDIGNLGRVWIRFGPFGKDWDLL